MRSLILLGCAALIGCDATIRLPPPATPTPQTPVELEPATPPSPFDALAPAVWPGPKPDVTNRYADDARAAALGHKLFFDPRFSGPLLDDANNGLYEATGKKGESGKIACAGCHIPSSGFQDTRSPRQQVSLGAGWTHRRAPSLLDVGQETLLMWDGVRDTAYSQVFSPIESPHELNSSRLFVAQQVATLYRAEYESIFGPLPDLSRFAALTPDTAGCAVEPQDHDAQCLKPFDDDVTRVVVNFGKAISAYLRNLSCGPSRFDAWVHGDASALTDLEQAGAQLFVGKAACVACHSGPFFSDGRFHNVGLSTGQVANFLVLPEDPGASVGVPRMLQSPLNARGAFSDGDDGRQAAVAQLSAESLLGAFRTPKLRCVSRRPSWTHAGLKRSLDDVVFHFDQGGDSSGYLGVKEIAPLDLTADERDALVAFLGALDGPGPEAKWGRAPTLP